MKELINKNVVVIIPARGGSRRLKRWMSNNFGSTNKKSKVKNQITNWQDARKIINDE